MENLEVTASKQVQTILSLYEAFGVGDIPFILDHVSEKFVWTDPTNPAIVPHGGRHEHKEGFLQFFKNLGDNTDTTLFAVEEYAEGENVVMVTGKHGIISKKTGKADTFEWVMVWKFENGQPVSGRSYYDTARAELAYT